MTSREIFFLFGILGIFVLTYILQINNNVLDIKDIVVGDYTRHVNSHLPRTVRIPKNPDNFSRTAASATRQANVKSTAAPSGAESASHQSKVNVLLVTAHRSGSTFLGELFNRNPDVFYLFEPLAGVQGEHSTIGCHRYPEAKINHLRKYFDCDAPLYYDRYRYRMKNKGKKPSKVFVDKNRFISAGQIYPDRSSIPSNGIQVVQPERGRCAGSGLCFRSDHQWSCDAGICHARAQEQDISLMSGHKDKNCMRCNPLSVKLINQVCESRSIIAQKVIRLCDINHLETMMTQIPNLKVILLFRDPRGIYGSRKRLVNPTLLLKTISQTCNYYEKALVSKLEHENLMYLRYEDLSREPLEMAKSIYAFIGRRLPDAIVQWITDSQHTPTPTLRPITTNQTLPSATKRRRVDPYSTRRNSTYTMMKWRLENSFHVMDGVQKICAKTIALAGYQILKNESEMKNLDFSAINNSPFNVL